MRVKLTTDDPTHRLNGVLNGKVITLPESTDPDEVFITLDETDRSTDTSLRLLASLPGGVIIRVPVDAPCIIHGKLEVEV